MRSFGIRLYAAAAYTVWRVAASTALHITRYDPTWTKNYTKTSLLVHCNSSMYENATTRALAWRCTS
jgi:hypothetical protein